MIVFPSSCLSLRPYIYASGINTRPPLADWPWREVDISGTRTRQARGTSQRYLSTSQYTIHRLCPTTSNHSPRRKKHITTSLLLRAESLELHRDGERRPHPTFHREAALYPKPLSSCTCLLPPPPPSTASFFPFFDIFDLLSTTNHHHIVQW